MLGVCEEKNDSQLKCFAVKGSTLEACIEEHAVTQSIAMIFATRIVHSIKVLVL